MPEKKSKESRELHVNFSTGSPRQSYGEYRELKIAKLPGNERFAKPHSTNREISSAIGTLCEDIASVMAQRKHVSVVLIDVAKTFDKVWHLDLKMKIIRLVLPTPYTKLLCDFLEDRSARIIIGIAVGEAIPLTGGVPQWNFLSPILFEIA